METQGIEDRRILTLVWKIEDIGLLKSGQSWMDARSPSIIARTLKEKNLCLFLNPNSMMETDEHIHIYLSLLRDSLNFPIDCEWSIIGCNGSPLVSGTMRNHVMKRREPFYMSGCPTHEEVFVTKKSVFLPHDTLTVQLRIWSSEGDLSADEFLSCRTRCETTNYSVLWPIPGFSTFHLNQEVTTRVTIFGILDNFLLKFSLHGVSLKNAEANVELCPLSITSALWVKLKVSVLDNERKVLKILKTDSEFFCLIKKKSLILPKLISREEILRLKNDCLRNDVLTLLCEIPIVRFSLSVEEYYYGCLNLKLENTKESVMFLDVSCQTSENSVDTSESSLQRRDNLGSLGEDLLTLYREQGLSDFELLSDDTIFKVHKNILSARSPVFKAMFSSDMKETVSNHQDVPDVDVHTLNRMLTFLYGDTVEPDLHLDGAAKLYYTADKYQIPTLKQQCSLMIQSSIQVSNVSEILTLADRHQDIELTSLVEEFFLNNFDEIMQNEDWENFQQRDPALAMKTVHRVYKKKLITKGP